MFFDWQFKTSGRTENQKPKYGTLQLPISPPILPQMMFRNSKAELAAEVFLFMLQAKVHGATTK